MEENVLPDGPDAPDGSEAPDAPFVVVGLGASAGGLEALESFFGGLPTVDSCAFVVVIHLAPDKESELADILAQSVPLPVVQVTERVEIARGHVYVIPPNRNLVMEDGHVALAPLENERRRRRPVDFFFRSLAGAYGDHSVAVVLSGTGQNGAVGVRAVKEAGGLILAQDPADAPYDEMPRSAIAAGVVDVVAPAAALGAEAVAYSDRLRRVQLPTGAPGTLPHDEVRAVQRVLGQLRARTGHDFAHYKRSTVLRRLERRLHVVGVDSLDAYADRLSGDGDEARELLKDLLISVTNFFRDAETFAVFERTVVPKLFEGKGPDDPVRVWCAACATGEEAYTVAMLLAEHAATLAAPPAVQVFATDLSEAAIRTAREGIYPESIEADVSPERLGRFFRHEARGYRVVESLRETVVFAPHSLLRDPPFSHVDLVTCRNLLIYFQRVLQERALELFAYALNPGGYLFLGTSETTEVAADAFHTVDKAHRIYQRREGDVPPAVAPIAARLRTGPRRAPAAADEPGEAPAPTASYAQLHRRLRADAAPPSVLVSETNEVVHFAEGLGPFLQIAGGDPTRNVLRLVRPELRVAVQTALFQALRERASVASVPARMDVDGAPHDVVVRVRPDPETGLFQVLFEAAPAAPDAGDGAVDARLDALQAELLQVKEQLQISIEEFETNREELQAQNEELQSTNEELRSTAEELETSKEEAQSMAEELLTVNDEMKVTVEELGHSKSDLENLIVSTEIATLFLDRQLQIKWFTPQVRALFHVRSSDVGRPLADLAQKFGDVRLAEDAEAVLDRLQVTEREVRTEDDRWHLVHVRPYRTVADRIDGVVVTFVDVTERHRQAEALRESEERYRGILGQDIAGVVFLDLDGRVTSANPRFYEIVGHTEADLVGTSIRDFTHPDDVERTLVHFGRLVAEGTPFSLAKRYVRRDGTTVWATSTVALVRDAAGQPHSAVALTVDISEQRRAEEALRAGAARATFRAGLGDVLRDLTDPADVQAEAARVLGEHLGASRVHYAEFEADGEHAVIARDYARGVPNRSGRYRMADFALLHDEARAGRTFVVPDVPADPRLSAPEKAVFGGLPVAALVVVPLVKAGRLVAVMAVHHTEPRAWTPEEVALIEETAERTWAAVERARAEAALRGSEAKLRLLIESATDYAIFTTDPDRHVTSWNAGAQALFGYAEDEIVGRLVDVLFTPEDRAEDVPEREAAHALAEGRAPDNRWHLRKDGTRFYVNGVTTPLRDGTVHGFVKIARDLTAQREAEAALRESEERYRTLFNRMDEGFCVIELIFDADGHAVDWRYLETNPAFDELTGLTDAVGRTVRSMIPDHEAHWFETYGRVARTGEPVRFVSEPRGLNRWYDLYAFPVGAPGDGRVAVLFSDISEQKRAEAEIQGLNATLERRVAEQTLQVRQLAARLAVAEQAERQRIAHVLHDDLQQHLFGLSMVLSVLKRGPGTAETRGVADRAAAILDEAVGMTRSLATELSPSILQADRLADLLEWLAGEKRTKYGLEVEVEVHDDVRVADPALRILLYQALREVLFNVVKHAGVPRARLVAYADGDCSAVRVEDDGAGFDAGSAGSAGAGFGLFSVRERIELVGGRFEVESAPGKGSRVTMSVPAGSAAPGSP